MGRRSDHNRDQLMDMAIAAAEAIVIKDGFHALTARRVASDIGYSVGTIYNIFENLDGLTLCVKARTLDMLYAQIKDIPKGEDVVADLETLHQAYFDFMRENPNTWGSILERAAEDGTPLPDWYLEKVSLPFSVVERALSPLFDEADAEERTFAARALWGGVHGIAILGAGNSPEAILHSNARDTAWFLILTFIEGLKRKE